MTFQRRVGLPPLGWFMAGLAASAVVASLVGIPPGEATILLAVITLAALVVVTAGLGCSGACAAAGPRWPGRAPSPPPSRRLSPWPACGR